MKIKIVSIFILLLISNLFSSNYPVHDNITSTVFWIGEGATSDNLYISNFPSAWDDNWTIHYGGIDSPDNRSGYFPFSFIPKENPFYVALPYNDFDENGNRKPEAENIIYWAKDNTYSDDESMCKNRWVKITKNGITVYAQWEDAGPFGEDDANYVFGSSLPVNTINNNAGIDVSPAVRDYLNLKDIDKVSWQFVDDNEVPDGPWKRIITFYNGTLESLTFEQVYNNNNFIPITLKVNSGWNLIGSSCKISNIQSLSESGLYTIWTWINNKWKVYSPLHNMMKLLNNYNLSDFFYISPFKGFWIYSLNNTSLIICKNIFWYQPSTVTTWYWQLQNPINININAQLYDIDLFDTSSDTIKLLKNSGKKVICYFNAGAYESWREDASLFQDEDLGNPLVDWDNERWLNINSENVREIMKKRLDLAVEKGCDGVEPDNVDGYSNNTGFNITEEDQINYNIFLSIEAHKRGLSIALKNDVNQISILEPYFDFAINEECHKYNECDKYSIFIQHGKPVFNAEYDEIYFTNLEEKEKLCEDSLNRNFRTLILPKNLDGSKFFSCDF